MGRRELVGELVADGVLHTPAIREAFLVVDRADFLSAEERANAYDNVPLPIGAGQTISQPWTVAFMLELLEPRAGHNILDVGSGSGWQTVLLAQIVSYGKGGLADSAGHVTALEIVPDLCHRSQVSIHRYGFLEKGTVEVHCRSAQDGFPARAPFDRIIAAAMADTIPHAWLEQLGVGGILVLPMKGSVWKITKHSDQDIEYQEYPGFAFVPFIV